jgi:hypothetical protein
MRKKAVAKARGVRVESSWDELIAEARQLLQPLLSWRQERLDKLYKAVPAQPFVAVARTLDAASQMYCFLNAAVSASSRMILKWS